MIRLLVSILFFPFAVSAQPVFFQKVFGTRGNDQARSVKQLPGGSIYLLGFSDSGTYGGIDAALSKLDQYGNLLWTKYYGNANDNYGLWLNKTNDGKLIFCGETQSNFGTQVDAFAIKVDTSGNIIWSKTYATPLNESFKYIEQTSDGGYIMCGYQTDAYAYNDTYVMKTNSFGDSLWVVNIGGPNNDYSDMVHQLPNGTYTVTGDTRSMGAGGYDVELTHLTSNGMFLWDFPYGDQYQNGCQGLFINSSGKYISYGETEIYTNSPFDFYLEQIDTSGVSQWKRTFGGANADAIFSLVQMPDKGYIFTGYSNSYSPGPLNLVVGRTDSAGIMQWIRPYGGPGVDIGYEIIHAVDGGVLIGGVFTDSVYFDSQYYLLHLDYAGLMTGTKEYGSTYPLLIYPNPSSGTFTVHCEDAGPGTFIAIYNCSGEKVAEESLITKNTQISLGQNRSPGIYFAEVYSPSGVHHAKLVVANSIR